MWLVLPLVSLTLFAGALLGNLLMHPLTPAVELWLQVLGVGALGAALLAQRSRRTFAIGLAGGAFVAGFLVNTRVPPEPAPLPAGELEFLVQVHALRPASAEGQLSFQVLGTRPLQAQPAPTIHQPWLPDGRNFVARLEVGGRIPLHGDILYLRGKLQGVTPGLHSHTFDGRAWARSRGISGTLFPTSTFAFVRPGSGLFHRLDRLRVRIERSILSRTREPVSGVLVAIVTGSKGGISGETRDRFAANGAAHVLAVSGLHLGLLSIALFGLLRRLFSWLPALVQRVPADILAAWTVIPCVLAYVVITGAPSSAIRAGIMSVAMLIALGLGRRVSGIHTLSLAFVLMVLLQPDWLLDIGFQLSLTATLGLVLTPPMQTPHPLLPTRPVAALVASIRVSTVATLATAPVLLWHFGRLPILSPFTNLIVVPPIALVSLPAAIVGALLDAAGLWGAAPLLWLAELTAGLGLELAESGEGVLDVSLYWGRPTGWALAGWSLLALLSPWLGRGGLRKTLIVTLGLGAMLSLGRPVAWRSGELVMHSIPVGQGDATLLQLPDRTRLLIDAGGVAHAQHDTATRSVLPYLWGIGVWQVDIIALSHSDYDHAGGLPESIRQLRPREVWLPPEPSRPILREIRAAAAEVGARVIVNNVPIARVLGGASISAFSSVFSDNQNDGSMVLKVCFGQVCYLLTGDIETPREEALVRSGYDLQADVLKVPHHGSRTSSTTAFLDAVAPRVALFHVGRDNHFGFPLPEILERYQARAIRTWQTDRGAIITRTDGERIWVLQVPP